ncbi:MAG: aminotransferase class I/II-fold pyridoxal phosphate-dependent enzyme, partial [Pseudomonadota bacterium]|nr:aminotransferase class I/II-fold pyridoxal phosphate-dependent enzyme [Pseudomonadota bacterium]
MYNKTLDLLVDYPFDRLRQLLDPIQPPVDLHPILMSLGEPQHAPPKIIHETISKNADKWGKYPPVNGNNGLLKAIAGWLQERYSLSTGFIDSSQHIVAVSGTKEALFMAGDVSITPNSINRTSTVLIPNPFYQVYMGAAVIRGANPTFLPASSETGFLPDFLSLEPEALDKTVLAYLCSPSNPQGTIAHMDYLKNVIELAQTYDFVLAVDECYAEIYDKFKPPGVLQACHEMGGNLKNILSFHSLSKRSNAP